GSADLLTETGGGGIDSIDYTKAYFGITFSLAVDDGRPQTVNPGVATTNTVALIGQFENLTGSAFSDVLYGNNANNALAGGDGNDLLFGGDPPDTFTRALGTDTLPGSMAILPGGLVVPGGIVIPDGSDTLQDGVGNDTILGGSGND